MTRGDSGELMLYDRRVLSVALDWTGLGVVAGQRSACAYTPVNKLRGGTRQWPPACTVGRHVPYEQGKRRRAASGRLCFATPAPIPHRAAAARMHVCWRGAGGLGGPLLLLSAEKTIASSHEDIRRAFLGDGGWRLGCS